MQKTLADEQVHNVLIMLLDHAHCLEAKDALSAKRQSNLKTTHCTSPEQTAQISSHLCGLGNVPPSSVFAFVELTRSFLAARSTNYRQVGSATTASIKAWPSTTFRGCPSRCLSALHAPWCPRRKETSLLSLCVLSWLTNDVVNNIPHWVMR